MSQDKELEIQLQFLDEAQEYLGTLEAALLGLSSSSIDLQKVNAALRAAHSIKGGAGLMGFQTLSQLAHRLEDSFKVLKTQKNSIAVDAELEGLLLAGVDCLRHVIESDRAMFSQGDRGAFPQGDRAAFPQGNRAAFSQGNHQDSIDSKWLDQATSVFDQLHQRLGEPQAEDANSILSPEEGQDVIPLLFQTEVEGCLQRLESVLESAGPCLREELEILTQELGGLGEMLQLKAFSQLCESVAQHLATTPDPVEETARLALQVWRRSQALVLTGNLDALPSAIDTASSVITTSHTHQLLSPEVIETSSTFDQSFLDDKLIPTSERLRPQPIPAFPYPEIDPLSQTSASGNPSTKRRTRTAKEGRAREVRVMDADSDTSTSAGEPQENTVRVPIKQLNQLNDLLGELTIERNGLDLNLKRLHNLIRTLGYRVQTLEQSNLPLQAAYDKVATQARTSSTVPLLAASSGYSSSFSSDEYTRNEGFKHRFDVLEMDRYSDLHLLSQAVMETIVQIQEVTSDVELGLEDTEQTARDLHKTAKQLQTKLTQVRMRPLSDIVDRFPRALRELSLQYGKPVQLKIHGENTLVDRNILEALSEPLMHLLRNAFDHGIENLETRRAAGKPEPGLLEIRAFHRSNRTLITISDDGGGISLDKIRSRARQMGLDEVLLAAASDEELLSLIFEPGFSTADEVTALSGRGVGMDVVRSNLKQVRGDIKVDTQAGVGTTFTISVPFTLSVTRVLLAESKGMMLAFPTDVIEEMYLLPAEKVVITAGSEVFEWKEMMVELIRLSQWLEFHCPHQRDELESPPSITVPTVLMLNQGSQFVGLQVDRCWGEQEVAIRKVEGGLPMPSGFNNCTILGDGRVVPLVNVPELLRWIASYEHSSAAPVAPHPDSLPGSPELPSLKAAGAPPLPEQKPIILVVDDSINVRRILALTLEKAGYQVAQAKDGQDAIDKLAAGLQAQAVICDIEMPRLDGYGFLARLKSNPAFENLPVAMLTSRSGDKHRQLAMSLGAIAYFSKPYNEQSLLQTLERLVNLAPVV